MPDFLILLRDDFDNAARAPHEQQQVFDRFVAWSEDLARRGIHRGVERLERDGRTARVRGGQVVVDGPYTEGKETVMGFFVVAAPSLEAAAQIAAEAPSAALGAAIEVRAVAPFPKPAG